MDFLEQAPVGFFLCRQDGKVLKLNQTIANWLGYTKEEILQAEGWQSFFTMGSKIYFETHFYPLLHIQKFALEIHLDLLKKHGTILPVLANARLVDSLEKSYTVFLFDITQRRQYEKELMHLRRQAEEYAKNLQLRNEELYRFARVAAHDLRSPLASMLGFIDFILQTYDKLSRKEITEYLAIISNTGYKLLDFINNLLLYYKQESNLFSEDCINLKDVFKEIVQTLNPKNEYSIQLKGENLNLPHNKIFWQLVLGNLVSNAIKYCDKEKVEILIEWKQKDSYLYLEVHDNGKGISKEEQEKVFLAFYHSTTLDRFQNQGIGIGLALIKQLIEKVNGKISLQSELGKGSTFQIQLPLHKQTTKEFS